MVGSQPGGLVHVTRFANVEAHVGFRPRDEKRKSCMNAGQPFEIDVSAIQYIEGSRFEDDLIQGVDVVDLTIGNCSKRWNRAVQIDHGVEFDRGLPLSKASPRKRIHAQVYSGSVDSVTDFVFSKMYRSEAYSLRALRMRT
jgi:hypothetical protein